MRLTAPAAVPTVCWTAGGQDGLLWAKLFRFINDDSESDTELLSSRDDIDFGNIKDGSVNDVESLRAESSQGNKLTLKLIDMFNMSDNAHETLEGLLDETLLTSLILEADAGDDVTPIWNFFDGSPTGRTGLEFHRQKIGTDLPLPIAAME